MRRETRDDAQLLDENKVYANVLNLKKYSDKLESYLHREFYLSTMLWQDRELDEEELLFKKCDFFERFTNPEFSDALQELEDRLTEAKLGALRSRSLVAYLVQSITKNTSTNSESNTLLTFKKKSPSAVTDHFRSMIMGLFTKKATKNSIPRKRAGYEDLLKRLKLERIAINGDVIDLWINNLQELEKQNIDPELVERVLVRIWLKMLNKQVGTRSYDMRIDASPDTDPLVQKIPEDIKQLIEDDVKKNARKRARSIQKKKREVVGISLEPATAGPSNELMQEEFDRQLGLCELRQENERRMPFPTEGYGKKKPNQKFRLEDVPENILVESVKRALASLDEKKSEILVGLAIDQLNAPENAQKCFMVFNEATSSIDSISRTARKLEDEIREISKQVARNNLPS